MKKVIFCFSIFCIGYSCSSPELEVLDTNRQVETVQSKDVSEDVYAKRPRRITKKNAQLSDYEIMAYLPYWGYIDNAQSNTNYDKYYYKDISTLLIMTAISKGSVLSNQGLIYGDNASHANTNTVDFKAMIKYIRKANPKLKILLALSDIKTTKAERAATAELINDTNRSTTINWLMTNYVDRYNLDGIDIDFEDTTLDPEYMGNYYSIFIKELATALHDKSARGRRKLCTATLSGWDFNRPLIATDDFINSVDLLGVQTYSADKMDYLRYNQNRNMKSNFEGWTSKGMPADKLAFGLSMWSKIADPSKSFGNQIPNRGSSNGWNWIDQLKQEPSANRYRPYLTSSFNTPGRPGSYEQRYNGLYEIRRKAEWVKSKGCRGVFGWELSKDPTTSDTSLRQYSYFLKLMDWRTSPQKYLPIVAYTTQDYYGSNQQITGGFHSLQTIYDTNWVACYEFDTSQPFNIGKSLVVSERIPNQESGSFKLPASWTNKMKSNKMYILVFFRAFNYQGTSHPFYKL